MNPIAELNRRLDNLIRLGTIAEVDHAKARCRVKTGQVTTDWLPWFSLRAGTTSTWNPPTQDEQCAVFSPSGELAQGIVLLGIFSTAHPAPGDQAGLDRTTYPDGAVIEYDAQAHALNAVLPAGGTATLTAPAGISITGDITLNGKMTATGDVMAGGISLIRHVHGGVQGGPSNTGKPQ